jgi:hypothetical protein
MTTTMAKVILTIGVLICGVSGQSDEDIKELSALYEQAQKMEAKYAELFTCLNVEDGKNVVLKEGCDLVVKKGNHKVEGQLHIQGTHIIDGGNLHVHNGLGSHDCSNGISYTTKTKCNGMGNIIIGHSPESSKLLHKNLSGSHNIIAGSGHQVYSHGSIVSGSDHTLVNAHSSTISGISNKALGEGDAVLGGSDNVAGYILGSVNSDNKASGSYATVTGGTDNVASGSRSSVSGGFGNKAKTDYSYCAGGVGNKASAGWYSTVVGGKYNVVSGKGATELGGLNNEVSKEYGSKIGDW